MKFFHTGVYCNVLNLLTLISRHPLLFEANVFSRNLF